MFFGIAKALNRIADALLEIASAIRSLQSTQAQQPFPQDKVSDPAQNRTMWD